MLKFVTVLPDLPLAPGIRFVGAALEYSVDEVAEKYKEFLNVSLVVKTYNTGVTCSDYDYAAINPIAKEFWRHDVSHVCMAVIEMGK